MLVAMVNDTQRGEVVCEAIRALVAVAKVENVTISHCSFGGQIDVPIGTDALESDGD